MALMDSLTGRLSLGFKGLEEVPAATIKKHGREIRELDVTNNYVHEFRFLTDIPNLETLIVDHNNLHSHVKFPCLPQLTTLWVNHNNITNLGYFIGSIGSSFPNLRYLSMMNNPAAPSFFNGGSFVQFTDYRYFVISQLPMLQGLDDKEVTKDERSEAERIYRQHMGTPDAIQARKRSTLGRKKSTKDNLPDLPVFT